MNAFDLKLLALPGMVDSRKSLPKHATKRWASRDPEKIIGMCWHQALSHDATARGVAKYHVGPNHISLEGLPGIAYTLFVERDGTVRLCNSVDLKTPSQGTISRVGDENADYLAVCFGGDFPGDGHDGTQWPTGEQIDAGVALWAIARSAWGWSRFDLIGHSRLGKAACPGHTLDHVIDEIRRGAR